MISGNAELPYWPFYCEENIWHLCDHPELAPRDPWVLFISNPHRSVALWNQRSAPGSEEPVIWDYHVILLCKNSSGWEAWDLDSRLPAPFSAELYLARTFPGLASWNRAFEPRFRLLRATEYRATLATDRRHMLDPTGKPSQTPPPWPIIGRGHNLMQFVSTTEPFHGEVFDLDGLRHRLAAI